jgi:Molybdopterin cofactor-binding domain
VRAKRAKRCAECAERSALECLERLAKLANWKPRVARAIAGGEIATGRGVSYIKYELVRTYVAVACDVEVNRKTGKIVVKRFYVAHDCGQIINPDDAEQVVRLVGIQPIGEDGGRAAVEGLVRAYRPIGTDLRFRPVEQFAPDRFAYRLGLLDVLEGTRAGIRVKP